MGETKAQRKARRAKEHKQHSALAKPIQAQSSNQSAPMVPMDSMSSLDQSSSHQISAMDPRKDPPFSQMERRSIAFGVGAEMVLAFMAWILSSPFLWWLLGATGILFITYAARPALFAHDTDAKAIASTPHSRTPSTGRWLLALVTCLGVAWIGSWLSSPPKPIPTFNSRLQITDTYLMTANDVSKGTPTVASALGLVANIHYRNMGTLPAQKTRLTCVIKAAPRPLNLSEEIAKADQVLASLDIPVEPGQSDIQPGEEAFVTCPMNDASSAAMARYAEPVAKGKAVMYVFGALQYRDLSLDPEMANVTEFCAWFSEDFNVRHICGRNRIFRRLAEIQKP